MTRLVRTELLKLRTVRGTTGTLAGALVLVGLVSAGTMSTADVDGAAAAGTPGNLANVIAASSIPMLTALVVGVLSMAGEFRHDTVTSTFLVIPRRGRVVAAKLVALGAVGVTYAAVAAAVALAVAVPWLADHGTDVRLLDREVAGALAGTLVGSGLAAAAGVAVGALVRNQTAALVGVAVWTLVVEGLVAVFVGSGVARWLPSSAAQAVAGNGDGLPLWGGALLFAGYTLAITATATRFTVTRDVT